MLFEKSVPLPFPYKVSRGEVVIVERERNVGVLPLPYFPGHVASTCGFEFRERCFAWARRDKNALFQITGAVYFLTLFLFYIISFFGSHLNDFEKMICDLHSVYAACPCPCDGCRFVIVGLLGSEGFVLSCGYIRWVEQDHVDLMS